MQAEIYPLEKVVIDGKEIFLGMEKANVEKLLGQGQQNNTESYYFESELRIDYDANACVQFIEFLGGEENTLLKPMIYGVSAFDTEADTLYAILADKNQGAIDDSENGYSYAFCGNSVGIWRKMRPEDFAELVQEMAAHGISTDNNPDLEKDRWKAHHWNTIGVGVTGYYQVPV